MEFIRDLPSRSPTPSRTPSPSVEVIDLTSPSHSPRPSPLPSPVDVNLIIDDIMEAHHQDILFYEKTLDAIVSHYEDEKRVKEPITEDHVKEITSIVSFYVDEKKKWQSRKTRPGKDKVCEKGGKKGGKKGRKKRGGKGGKKEGPTWQPPAGPSRLPAPARHTGLTKSLREGRWWETKDVTRVVVHDGTGKEKVKEEVKDEVKEEVKDEVKEEEEEEKYEGKGKGRSRR
jgi:hypothetical protein